MRILFLDFGGVTHPCGTDDEARAVHRGSVTAGVRLDVFCWFDILPTLLAPHDDVYVVVHSNWRFSHSAACCGVSGPMQRNSNFVPFS